MENKKNLVSIQLINGQTILSECSTALDLGGSYELYYPVRPILIEEKVVFVPLNPFSDSRKFLVHKDHILTMGEMHFMYIDLYIEAQEKMEKDIINKYDELMKPKDLLSDVQNIPETIH